MELQTNINYTNLLSEFAIEGGVEEVTPYGSGHINGTFYIKNTDSASPDYLLQRINNYVFKDVPLLIENIKRVTAHLLNKPEHAQAASEGKLLALIPCKNGECYYKDGDGEYWRVYNYLADTRSYDLVETEQQAYEAGKAFGQFQAQLADLDPESLKETIPNFHNVDYRLGNFKAALEQDPVGRVAECFEEIRFLTEREDKMRAILKMGEEGRLPLRITHNDTKINNVLFNKEGEVQCVIDLDTVMPGFVAYDFGDAIRTIINTAEEDEADISKINLNIPLFKAYTRGYLNEAIEFLSDNELYSLIHGVLLLPYTQAVRFLTDYIDGDKYYKIAFPTHNLQRTRAQIQLLKNLEGNREELEQSIYGIAAEIKSER